MTFTIAYRDASGAMREEAVEAASRADALSALKARGISPISLRGAHPGGPQSLAAAKSGGPQSLAAADATGRVPPSRGRDGARPSHSPTRQLANSLTAIAALAAIAIGTWLYLSRPPAAPATDATERVPPSGTRRESGGPQSLAAAGATEPGGPQSLAVADVAERVPPGAPAPSESPLKELLAPPPTNRTFSTTTEQVLGHVFTTRLGSMPFPVPNLPQDELARIGEILERDVPFKDSDDARTLDVKETVAAAKRELREFLAEGGRPQDFLKHYHGVLRRAFEEHQLACAACEKMKEENPGLYPEFLASVNKRLADKGIRAVTPEDLGDDEESAGGETAATDELQ